jgi:hypothetical protein
MSFDNRMIAEIVYKSTLNFFQIQIQNFIVIKQYSSNDFFFKKEPSLEKNSNLSCLSLIS